MPADRDAPEGSERPRPGPAGTLARLALVGLILAAVAGTFAYLGGWLTPNALTPGRLTDAFEHVAGVNYGFRRNHAKGVGVSGVFESNGRSIGRRAGPWSAAAPCRGAGPTSPMRATRYAASGCSSACRTASYGGPR